jgi:hypothetical protein
MYQVVANAVHRILLSWWLYIQSIKPEMSILWVQSLCVELCADMMGIIDNARYIHEDKLFFVFQFNKHSGMSSTKNIIYV